MLEHEQRSIEGGKLDLVLHFELDDGVEDAGLETVWRKDRAGGEGGEVMPWEVGEHCLGDVFYLV